MSSARLSRASNIRRRSTLSVIVSRRGPRRSRRASIPPSDAVPVTMRRPISSPSISSGEAKYRSGVPVPGRLALAETVPSIARPVLNAERATSSSGPLDHSFGSP